MIDTAVILKRFEEPDEVRTFDKGRFEIVRIGAMTIGRATYEPGWKWSEHVGPAAGQTHCRVEHLGLVVSGHATGIKLLLKSCSHPGGAGLWKFQFGTSQFQLAS